MSDFNLASALNGHPVLYAGKYAKVVYYQESTHRCLLVIDDGRNAESLWCKAETLKMAPQIKTYYINIFKCLDRIFPLDVCYKSEYLAEEDRLYHASRSPHFTFLKTVSFEVEE